MMAVIYCKKSLKLLMVAGCLSVASVAFSSNWEINDLELADNDLPLSVKQRLIFPSMHHLWQRSQAHLQPSPNGRSIDPLFLPFSDSYQGRERFLERFATPEKYTDLVQEFAVGKLTPHPRLPGSDKRQHLAIYPGLFQQLSIAQIQSYFARTHYELTLKTRDFTTSQRQRLKKRVSRFLDKMQIYNLKRKWQSRQNIALDPHLLPRWAGQRMAQYPLARGRNCFEAALSFQIGAMGTPQKLNLIREPNYDAKMINNDEMYFFLKHFFYEVNPQRSEVIYGDIIVFLSEPLAKTSMVSEAWSYKLIKHASVYLFGGYSFSKGSKYADSPYTVQPLIEEWSAWQKIHPQLHIKVFRWAGKRVKSRLANALNDWLS